MKKKYLLLALLLLGFVPGAMAQYEFTSTSLGSYVQDFNTLSGSTFANNSTIPGVYAQAEFSGVPFTPTVVAANDGSNTAANYYHFGEAGSTDRSFGGIASTTTINGIGHVGIRLKNSSGVTIRNLDVQYAMEQWYNSGRQDEARVAVSYMKGTNLGSLLNAAGTWTTVAALSVDAPSTTTVVSSRDGNSASNRRVKQVTLSGLNLADGQEIMLRWSYVLNTNTNGNGLSIDDVLVTPVTGIYYSKATGDLDALGSWGTNTNGTGTAPPDFAQPNTTYYVQGTVTTSRISGTPTFPAKTIWSVSGANSKVVIGVPGGAAATLQLANNDDINATIDVGANATFTTQQPTPSFRFGRIDNSSTVEYLTTGQPISIAEPSYGNLKVTGAGVKLLTASTVVNGNLTLSTNAKLQLGNNNLSIIRGGAVIGYSSAAFIVTDGKGSLQQSVANTGTDVVFPVGSSLTSYTPVSLQQPSSTTARNEDVFSVRVLDGLYRRYDASENGMAGTLVEKQNVKKTWLIGEEVAGNSDITMRLQWNVADEMTGADDLKFDRTKAYIGHYTTSGTVPYFDKTAPAAAAAGSVTNSYVISRAGITGFSPFAVSSWADGPLPVELLAFEAARTPEAVRSTWKTASERNSRHFVVERSTDGKAFTAVGTVAAHGTTTAAHSYSFLDTAPLPGLTYYRLQQVDLDGTVAYSPVVVVAACGNCPARRLQLAVAPNPGAGLFRLLDQDANSQPLVGTVSNLLGATVQQLHGESLLDLRAQPAGVYLLRVSTAQGPVVVRVVKE